MILMRSIFLDKNGKFSITALFSVWAVYMIVDTYIGIRTGRELNIELITEYVLQLSAIAFTGSVSRVGIGYLSELRKPKKGSNLPGEVPEGEETAKKEVSVYHNSLSKFASAFIGTKEIKGEATNPHIASWLTLLGWDKKFAISNDETPWCSTFVNAMAKMKGLECSQSPRAKSWLNTGSSITIDKVRESLYPQDCGIVAVFHRGAIGSPAGHVVIFEKWIKGDKNKFQSIGGNESDQVKRSIYSIESEKFIEFRMIKPTSNAH